MADKRHTRPTLFGSRIYVRFGFFQYMAPEPIADPKTGEVKRWHKLCPVTDGETKARVAKDDLLNRVKPAAGAGDFPVYFQKWRKYMQDRRKLKEPRDPARLAIWLNGNKALESVYGVIERGFADFNLVDVRPVDIGVFLDHWEGRRSAIAYRGHLSKFFKWTCKKNLRETNPATANLIELEAAPKRKDYITAEQFAKVREAVTTDARGRDVPSGKMVQAYLDLTYLMYQRTTDVRLLRRNEVDELNGRILVTPTKTERSSGGSVYIQITPEIAEVLARIKEVARMGSLHLIHTAKGQAYTASGMRSAFNRACVRVGVAGVTIKDIRHLAASAAKRAGYTMDQLQVGLVHTDQATTRGYVSDQDTPTSEVNLILPRLKVVK